MPAPPRPLTLINATSLLYFSIQREPFKIPEDDGNDLMHTFFNPDKEGWLSKQGGRLVVLNLITNMNKY